ncbi:MAG: transglutaminase family protein [Pirellulaceae bacterium]
MCAGTVYPGARSEHQIYAFWTLHMWLQASCELDLQVQTPTPFLLMLRPRSGLQQWVAREEYVLKPGTPAVEFTDSFGNLCQRLVAPAGHFGIHTSCEVEVAEFSDIACGAPFVPVELLPETVLPFLLPSRFCESDRFTQLASELVVDCQPGYDQCVAILSYIKSTLRYVPGAGLVGASACQVHEQTQAVCRDMAHLGIALTRAIAIPARMVVGYLETLIPMDLHAWYEVYVGNRWYTFDPTQESMDGGRVAIAYGRDAADVAIFTQFGAPIDLLRMEVSVKAT